MNFFKKTFGFGDSAVQVATEPKDAKKETQKPPSSLLSLLSSLSLGMDVLRSGISLPVSFHEPMTNLQRHAEMLAHADILDKALDTKDSLTRLAYIAAFGVTGFIGTERLFSDFNPILGETFEYIDKRNDTKFLAEQVSHHPPISACHGENNNWTFWQNSEVAASFLGNSVEVDTQGRTHIYYKETRDHFFFTNPKLRIHNLILGSLWIEHYGDLAITNLKTGESCTIVFKKSGFLEGTRYDVDGHVKDAQGNPVIYVYGYWNKTISAKWLVDTPTHPKGHVQELWRVPEGNFLGGRYNFTKYAQQLLEVDDEHTEELLPGSDSRLRIDRRALGKCEWELAQRYKRMLEERQRADRRQREATEGNVWQPVWFKKIPAEKGGHNYVYCGNYWSQREQKKQKLRNGEDASNLLRPAAITGTACDFRGYLPQNPSPTPAPAPIVSGAPLEAALVTPVSQ